MKLIDREELLKRLRNSKMFNADYPMWVEGVINGMPYKDTEQKDNKMNNLKVKLDNGAFMPKRAHSTDAGLDLCTPKDFSVREGDRISIDTGIHVLIPDGYVGMIKSKSGLNVKYGIKTEGVIDAGYTGSIVVCVYNNGDDIHSFKKGDKISQLVILPIETPELDLVDEFPDTDRGAAGFGSTGR